MTQIQDLKGYSQPLTPKGISSVVGDMPWHFGNELLNIVCRTDPASVAAFLPAPLEPGDPPDRVVFSFSKWWSLWDNQKDMPFVNPERTFYTETVIWIGCAFKGRQGIFCVQAWVDNDFSIARGLFMGFPKKLGQTYKSDYSPMNPAMPPLGPGTRMKGYVTAHGERLMEGTLEIREKIGPDQLLQPMGLPLFNIRHFPSIVPGAPPSVLELVTMHAENLRYGDIWRGDGSMRVFASEIEEHDLFAPREVLDAYFLTTGCTITGGEVLHSWV